MTPDLKVQVVKIDDLTPDPANARKHSQKNLDAIAGSLRQFGQRRPLVVHGNIVIAGNGTLEAAKSLGWERIAITRVPVDWTPDQARAYALADNRTAELAEWDSAVLADQLIELDAVGFDLSEFGFESLNPPTDPGEGGSTDPYIHATSIPQYEIKGERPSLASLYDTTKTNELRAEIEKADVPEDVREFLVAATHRHTVFDYRRIAEFYPHANPEVQRLIERSALVIIDIDDAIRNGYAKFVETIADLEEGDADA